MCFVHKGHPFGFCADLIWKVEHSFYWNYLWTNAEALALLFLTVLQFGILGMYCNHCERSDTLSFMPNEKRAGFLERYFLRDCKKSQTRSVLNLMIVEGLLSIWQGIQVTYQYQYVVCVSESRILWRGRLYSSRDCNVRWHFFRCLRDFGREAEGQGSVECTVNANQLCCVKCHSFFFFSFFFSVSSTVTRTYILICKLFICQHYSRYENFTLPMQHTQYLNVI